MIAALTVFVVAAIATLWAVSKLAAYRDVIELAFDHPPDATQADIKNMRIREIRSFSIVTRYAGLFASQEDSRSAEVSVYMCGPELNDIIQARMLHGNFLSQQGNVVIDEDLAWMLFSYTDCVGRDLTIGGMTFTIVGVTTKADLLKDVFGSLEAHPVYVFDDGAQAWDPSDYTLVVKCRENTGDLALSRLSSSALASKADINIGAMARFNEFIARVLLLICVCLPLHALLSVALNRWRAQKKIDWAAFGISAALLIAAIWLIAGLELVVDTRLIPSTLADGGEIIDKLRSWSILVNNGNASGGLFDATARAYAAFARVCGIVAVIAGWRIKRIIAEGKQ